MLIDVSDSALFNPIDMKAAIDAQLRTIGGKPHRGLSDYVPLICGSLARVHADSVRVLERQAGRRFKRIPMVGGGSQNGVLCQATADASALPVVSLALEGAAVGNLGSQLIALGAVEDLGAFRRHLAADLKQAIYKTRS